MTDNDNTLTPQIGPFPGKMILSTAKAIEAMKAGKPGDKIDLKAMAELTGRDCGNGSLGRGNVDSAIRHVEGTHGVVWRWSRPDQAWLCLDSKGRLGDTKGSVRRASKIVRRSLRVASTITVSELDADDQRDCGLTVASLQMMQLCGSSGFRKQLVGIEKPREPEVGRLIELMWPKG